MTVNVFVVLEVLGEDAPHPMGHQTFVVPPRVGEVIMMEMNGGRIVADVTSVIHAPAARGLDGEPTIQIGALIRPEGEPN
jgi:hypothetical protein